PCLLRPGGVLADLEVDLLAEDRHGPRRLDADPHLLAHDREYRHLDVVPDHDALVGLSCKDQHGASAQPYLAPRPAVKGARHRNVGILSMGNSKGRCKGHW